MMQGRTPETQKALIKSLFSRIGDLIGFCGVGPERVGDVEVINLGYRLARRYWNQGLASEAARGVLEHAFDQLQLESVVVIIEPEHVASLRVAEKAGFSDFRLTEFYGRPVRLYRLTRQGWRSLGASPVRSGADGLTGQQTPGSADWP